MRTKPLPPLKLLHDRYRYDPGTGDLIYRYDVHVGYTGRRAGSPAHPDRYVLVSVNNVAYTAHRIIWAMCHGRDPGDACLDHVNGNRSDNRIANLRLATVQENRRNSCLYKNNRCGIKGVSALANGRYRVRIRIDGKLRSLGTYRNKIFAGLVYARAAKIYFGEFWCIRLS